MYGLLQLQLQTCYVSTSMIKIDFTINGFSDALHLADDHGLSNAKIKAMKQARYDQWRDCIDNPPPVVDEPVVDEPVVEE